MKHWVLAFLTCGAVTAIAACSSDDSSGGGGTTGAGGSGGGIGGTGGGVITGGTGGGVTGGTGGTTSGGGTGGGGDLCGDDFFGATCMQLSTNDPVQTACIKGECCDEMDACLSDAECAAFLSCSSKCGQAGGTPQSCGAECQPCISAAGTPAIITGLNDCLLACGGDGGTTDAGTGGAPADAATD